MRMMNDNERVALALQPEFWTPTAKRRLGHLFDVNIMYLMQIIIGNVR